MPSILNQEVDKSLDEFSEFSFNVETMERAKQLFTFLKEEGVILEGEFNSTEWMCNCKARKTTPKFSFDKLKDQMLFWQLDVELVINSLKSWILMQLPERSEESLKKYYEYVCDLTLKSKFFDEALLEDIRDFLMYNCDDRRKWNLCIPTLNYLDFLDESLNINMYRNMLMDVKESINMENVSGKVRKLPKAMDILTFSLALENFMDEVEKRTQMYYQFYPLYLWWKLSNVIPMRPSEFCDIARNSLSDKDNKFYIRLPRKKQKKNRHRIQIVDTIAIPKELYLNLKKYKDETEIFGNTNTLISANSIEIFGAVTYKNKGFSYYHLSYLLEKFYTDIIDKEPSIKYEDKVNLGDTRHFAFLNLMRQGYHPIEIARIGGHTSLQAQYHYQQHMEYWVDFETVQLMYRLKLDKSINNKLNLVNESLYDIDDAFIIEKILKPSISGFKRKLEIGYCTDPDMYCQSDGCIFVCNSWRIDSEEFIQHRQTIQAKYYDLKNEVRRLTNTLRNIYKIAFQDISDESDVSEISVDYNKDLHYTKSELDTALFKLASFNGIFK